jgi:hypothetical protein
VCTRHRRRSLEHKNFVNRPAYFADYTVSTNKLVAISKEVLGCGFDSWSVNNVPMTGSSSKPKPLMSRIRRMGLRTG